MSPERWARLVVAVAVGLPLLMVGSRWVETSGSAPATIELHGRMADDGGWTPGDIVVGTGQRVRLRLMSDDVIHGFGIGKLDLPAVEMKPGRPAQMVITFMRPGTFTFYCTRWCGKNHWRMRGTIEVRAGADPAGQEEDRQAHPPPAAAGLDLDAPHPAPVLPDAVPSAARAESLPVRVRKRYARTDYYRSHSPADAWRALRAEPTLARLKDEEVWDVVARLWWTQGTPTSLRVGTSLFAANCAACHGERGRGDGVLAPVPPPGAETAGHHGVRRPADFTDRRSMLGANPALLYSKIQRGGMGTGMPNWGPILTEEQTWALVQYLWTFQFPVSRGISPDRRAKAPAGMRSGGPE